MNGQVERLADGTLMEKTPEGTIIVHNETTPLKPIPIRKYGYVFPENLSKQQIKQLQQWMRPDEMSEDGFLNKREKLLKVCQRDQKTLDKLGITYDDIANALDHIEKIVNESHYNPLHESGIIHGHLEIRVTGYFGHQECPFEELEEYEHLKQGKGSYDFNVINTFTNETLFFSALHSHLIRYHHFFEGHTAYRLDPEQCVKVLEIISDNN